MINKLLANLPFNPSLIEDVSFYTKRLRQEESLRRTGLILVVLSMFVQIFAATIPPEKSFAASTNDVINGGVSTLPELQGKCKRSDDVLSNGKPGSNKGAKGLYERFGLSCAELVPESCAEHGGKKICNVDFNFQSMGAAGVKTVGRESTGASCDLGPYGPHQVSFCGRNAATWSGVEAAYDFGVRKGSDGVYYHIWVLKGCGNIAYVREEPKSTEIITGSPIENTGGETTQTIPPELICARLSADRTVGKKSMTVRLTAQYESRGEVGINGFTFDFGDGSAYKHNGAVIDHTYTNDTLQKKEFTARVTINSALGDRTNNSCVTQMTLLPEVCETNAELGPNDPACGVCRFNPDLAPNDPRCKPPVCENNPDLKPDDPKCKCPDNPDISATDAACGTIGKLKKASNITQNLDTDKTITAKARAGDILEYSLISTNTNYVAAKSSVVIEDYIGDILDYANIDEAFLAAQGGTFDKTAKKVIWANQEIAPNGQVTKLFRVTMKSPIPSTNQPNTTAPDYDCKIENDYGNDIAISVDCPVIKSVEKLPNTGPGTTVGIAFVVTVISGYFFARSRLLAKELDIVKRDYTASGA